MIWIRAKQSLFRRYPLFQLLEPGSKDAWINCSKCQPIAPLGKGSDNRARSYLSGPRAHAAVGATAAIPGEVGAIHKGEVVKEAAGGIPGIGEEVLGAAPVGTRVLLRDGGFGG